MTISATPNIPAYTPSVSNNAIKPATPDLIQFNDSDIPIEFMTDLMFEDIGGQEIISISRNDTVNGQKVIYAPIKNTSQIGQNYGPQNLFIVTDTSSSYFNNYSISFQEKVPEVGSNATENQVLDIVYVDGTNGDIVVNVINMRNGEQVEIDVLDHIKQVDDILY